MPLGPLDQQTIDAAVDDLFTPFYTLPKDDCIAALDALSRLETMDEKAGAYPPLPELFQNPVYQSQEMRASLKALSEIMYNQQPQNPTAFSGDQADVHHGKLGLFSLEEKEVKVEEKGEVRTKKVGELVSRSGANPTSKDVHDYMRSRFATAAYSALALHEIQAVTRGFDAGKKASYYKYFADWVSDAPDDIKVFLFFDGTLKPKIEAAFKATFAEERFKTFLPHVDPNLSVHVDGAINHLFSQQPTIFDKPMGRALHALFSNTLEGEESFLNLDVLKTSHYQSVQEKLKQQLKNADPHFSRDVLLSFIRVAEIQELLNRYGWFLQINHRGLVKECIKICEDYVNHLDKTPESEWAPLENGKLDEMSRVLSSEEFLKEKDFINWTTDFFASYFLADQKRKDILLAKLFYFALDQGKIKVPDDFLDAIYREEKSEKGFLDIKPYHINRIFLHAFTVPVDQWSAGYRKTLTKALKLLGSSNEKLNMELKRDSYPPELTEQLRSLLTAAKERYGYLGISLSPYNYFFPLFHYPRNLNEWMGIIKNLPPDQIIDACKNLEIRQGKILLQRFNYEEITFESLFKKLRPEQITAFLKTNLSKFIKEFRNFKDLVDDLHPEQITAVLKTNFSSLIRDFENFKDLIRDLDTDQKFAVLTELKNQNKLQEIIRFPHSPCKNLGRLISCFRWEEIPAVLETLKELLPTLIPDADSFGIVLSNVKGTDTYSSLKKRKAVCIALEDYLSQQIINGPADAASVLKHLDPRTEDMFYRTLGPLLIPHIKTIDDYLILHTAHTLSSSFCYEDSIYKDTDILHDNFRGIFPDLIKTTDDIRKLDFLPPEEKKDILNILLIDSLNKHVEERTKKAEAPEKKTLHPFWNKLPGIYSEEKKIKAITALVGALMDESKILDEEHIRPLSTGETGKVLEKHLETFRPGVTVEKFLNQFTRPVHGRRRSSSSSSG